MKKGCNNWQWQLQNAIVNVDELVKHLPLSPEEIRAINLLSSNQFLPLSITPHYLRLINASDKNDPLKKQIIPKLAEYKNNKYDLDDPLGETKKEVLPNLVHRYPNRVLLLVTNRCASYCRFCTRKRMVAQEGQTPKKQQLSDALDYIKSNPQITDVILSGGDSLIFSDNSLRSLLSSIRQINSVKIIRIASRMLTFAPMRITDDLVAILKNYAPIYFMSHFNHVNELSDQARLAIKKLINNGITVLNQTVLLKGVNDSVADLADLFNELSYLQAVPYYLHQCDLSVGSSHFRVPVKKALSLLGALRGNISGVSMPSYVIDIPGGHGKVPLTANAIIKQDEEFIYLQGFDGQIASYPLV